MIESYISKRISIGSLEKKGDGCSLLGLPNTRGDDNVQRVFETCLLPSQSVVKMDKGIFSEETESQSML